MIEYLTAIKNNKELWELFTRREEYFAEFVDQFNRIRYYSVKQNDIMIPHVSDYLIKKGMEIKYPDGKAFAVCLSHDIDNVTTEQYKVIYGLYSCIKKKNYVKMLPLFKSLFNKANKKWDVAYNFNAIMDLEKKYNAKSTFFFMVEEKGAEHFGYNITDLKEEIIELLKNGWEIALHGGCDTYKSLEEIQAKKKKLEVLTGKEIIGYRNHRLSFSIPETWKLLAESGFKYDASYGYVDMVGFRNGMCHPFYPYDIKGNDFLNIVEIPLNIMEGTLFDYMKLNVETSWKYIKHILDETEKRNGVASVLWHNTHLDGSLFEDSTLLYEKILNYCYNKNAWLTSAENIISCFTNSSKNKL